MRELSEERQQMLRTVYKKYGGRSLDKMEAELRSMGWTSFQEFRLYSRHKTRSLGWIKRYRLDDELSAEQLKALKASRAKSGFDSWIKTTSEQMVWAASFHGLMTDALARVTKRRTKRLMFFLPPRHGKSEMVTIRYAAWRLIRDPKVNIIIGCYNQKLANRFSRRIQRVAMEFGLERKNIRDAKNAIDEWETGHGGGVKAVGVGAGITGFGADLIIIDDPVKSRAEAESKTYRERVWDWFNDDIYTRLAPGAAIILIQTRWHEDDLAGRLLKQTEDDGDVWEHLTLPALAEASDAAGNAGIPARTSDDGVLEQARVRENRKRAGRNARVPAADALGRKPGEALWPERYDEKYLEKVRRQLGSYSFSALYQQRPVPASGGIFKREWFTRVVKQPPPGLRWVRGYDLAVSTKTSADYTASFRCAFDKEGNLYIADGFRRRVEYPEQRRYVLGRISAERDTIHCVEKALHGQALVQDLWREREVRSRPLRSVRVDGDKLTRALAWASKAEAGKVILVEGGWIREFLDEVSTFPAGTHDDQVDAVSLAVRALAGEGKRAYSF